jgi:outer membrane protein OmpA-like peptidoglycan-associated protein
VRHGRSIVLFEPAVDEAEVVFEAAADLLPGVRWVQAALNLVLGRRLTEDGVAGTATRAALRDFQGARGLVADGLVGPRTAAALREALLSLRAPGAPCEGIRRPAEELVGFAFDDTRLQPAHLVRVGQLARCAAAARPASVTIVGHTDRVGDDAYNMTLGLRRAEEVARAFKEALGRGSPGSVAAIPLQVDTRGEAEQLPGSPEQNRRVQVFLGAPRRPPRRRPPRPRRPRPGPPAPPAPVGRASLVLVAPAAGTTLAIDAAGNMPRLVARVTVTGVTPDPTSTTDFDWSVSVSFDATGCRNGPHRRIAMVPIRARTRGGDLTLAFPAVRGGSLEIVVRAVIGGSVLETRSPGLRIVGTNPRLVDLGAALPHDALRRIARHESGCRQFTAAADGGVSGCPLFSGDRLGGAGVMQITVPRPTDDEVWSWRANVAAGIRVFNGRVAIARRYPAQVRGSRRFRDLVTALNADRAARGLAALQVTLPDFTESGFNVAPTALGQVELDAIRGFNGWAGRDGFGFVLHEFRVALDPQGRLIVDPIPGTNQATARWIRVPAAARPQATGDPDYVAHVLAAAPCQ